MKKKRLTVIACAIVASLSMNVVSASAANTADNKYEYTLGNNLAWHATNRYEKTDPSKVYVKPSKSPSGKTQVQTWCNVGGEGYNKTKAGTVTLSDGYAYGITNYVYEDGDKTNGSVITWLKVKPTSGVGVTSGVWSPDWSGVTSVTMVLCGLTGSTEWDPYSVAQYSEEQGYYVWGEGTS